MPFQWMTDLNWSIQELLVMLRILIILCEVVKALYDVIMWIICSEHDEFLPVNGFIIDFKGPYLALDLFF